MLGFLFGTVCLIGLVKVLRVYDSVEAATAAKAETDG